MMVFNPDTTFKHFEVLKAAIPEPQPSSSSSDSSRILEQFSLPSLKTEYSRKIITVSQLAKGSINTLSENENAIEFHTPYFRNNYSEKKLIPKMKSECELLFYDQDKKTWKSWNLLNTVYETSLDFFSIKSQTEIMELSSYAGNVVNTRSVTNGMISGNNLEFELEN